MSWLAFPIKLWLVLGALVVRLRWMGAALLLSTIISALSLAGTGGVLFSPQEIKAAGSRYGEMAKRRLMALQKLIANSQDLDEMEKLKKVNGFFNRTPYKTDAKHWKQKDYWATPLEMLGTNGGDCEDYSIAKYLTLRQLGVDDEKLRITYVKAIKLNEAHMVLSYYPTPEAEPYILDNLNKLLLKASLRTDLAPVYSFNGSGLWVSKGGGGGQKAGSSSRLKRWREMKDKLEQGG